MSQSPRAAVCSRSFALRRMQWWSYRALRMRKRMFFLIPHAAVCFLAQIAPDLRDVAPEGLAAHDLGRARARQIDVDDAFNLAGAIGHHQDTIGHLDRLGDVVCDQ